MGGRTGMYRIVSSVPRVVWTDSRLFLVACQFGHVFSYYKFKVHIEGIFFEKKFL